MRVVVENIFQPSLRGATMTEVSERSGKGQFCNRVRCTVALADTEIAPRIDEDLEQISVLLDPRAASVDDLCERSTRWWAMAQVGQTETNLTCGRCWPNSGAPLHMPVAAVSQ